MRRISLLPSTVLCSLAAFAINHSEAAEQTSAVSAYTSGNYDQALNLLNEQVKTRPSDPATRYMLGNVYMKLNRREEAIRAYSDAIKFDHQTSITAQSVRALVYLYSVQTPSSPAESEQSESDSSMTNSTKEMSSQTNEVEAKLDAECDAKVARIMKEAEEQGEHLKKEMDERIAANGSPVFLNSIFNTIVCTYDPSAANDEIRAEYKGKVEEIKNRARARADSVTLGYKERITALESSTTHLERTYASGGSINKNIQLMPQGTNIYLRNFQTRDQPSGHPVPLQAVPSKSLVRKSDCGDKH